MDFNVLGPLLVRSQDQAIQLRLGQESLLLTVLIANVGRAVSLDTLIDALWQDGPPSSARKTAQILLHRLRKKIGHDRIRNQSNRYQLAVPGHAVDADRFCRLADRGRQLLHDGRPQAAAECLEQALGLWRGPAYAEAEGHPAFWTSITYLNERRLVALEYRVDADLHRGRHVELTYELASIVAENPLRERFREQQMLALHRSGRTAEALRVYQDTRQHFLGELGIEPGPQLRQLQRDILTAESGHATDVQVTSTTIGR